MLPPQTGEDKSWLARPSLDRRVNREETRTVIRAALLIVVLPLVGVVLGPGMGVPQLKVEPAGRPASIELET